MSSYLLLTVFVMAVMTYLPRMLPLTFFKKEIHSRFIRSLLYYVPYAALASMTFPAIFFSTTEIAAALAGFATAVFMALRGKGLLPVAAVACVTVFAVEQAMAAFF